MNEQVTEKDHLLLMLTEMNHQVEELELMLTQSFSDLRRSWIWEEVQRLAVCEQKISSIEVNGMNGDIHRQENHLHYRLSLN